MAAAGEKCPQRTDISIIEVDLAEAARSHVFLATMVAELKPVAAEIQWLDGQSSIYSKAFMWVVLAQFCFQIGRQLRRCLS